MDILLWHEILEPYELAVKELTVSCLWLYANSCGFQSGNPADVHQWTFLLRL